MNRENNSASFIFASLLNGDQLVKEKIVLIGINPLSKDPMLNAFVIQGSQEEIAKEP